MGQSYKGKDLLTNYCQTEIARAKSDELIIHTEKKVIDLELRRTHEFRQLISNSIYFPNDYILNLARELKLLSIPGAVLSGEQVHQIRKLAESMEKLFRWFDKERRVAYPALSIVLENTFYEKAIITIIDEVLDENAQVKDTASDELRTISYGAKL